ncbi:hypothetical protein BT96DRAFT_179382 [Gymnopus androsaceus JB14]|uniref:Uncharacterized protein n=1 Tax=Gymnopus androsaceus JB14 TaxID=1447944 RepID=A0A6A4HBW8_9AGAR|nr:hypothetical protein BT96DRAFT_179382 [Gymnopus androsaceus JB14]
MALAQYLSKPRIEGPLWLNPVDIPFLRARLLKAETRLESLEAQISEVLDERALLRNVLAPVRRVPSEILSNIFEHSCTPGTSITDEIDFDVVRSTFVLARVCVAWRKTAHATPQLWSYLRLDLRRQPHLFKGDVSWVKEWLSRGRSLPLDLDLRFQWYHTLDKEDLAQGAAQMLESILDFRHRIRSCSIVGDLKLCLPLFRLPHSSLPELKEINLIHFSATDGLVQDARDFPSGIEAFLGAPKLRRVRISDLVMIPCWNCWRYPQSS